MKRLVHALEQVEGLFEKDELARLLDQACAAAESSPDWRSGKEHIFEIEDEPYAYDGITLSAFIIRHMGTRYEIDYYHGLTGEWLQ